MRKFILFTFLAFFSCSSGPIVLQNIKAPTGTDATTVIGEVQGRGCGTLLLIISFYQFIPATLNGALQEAYDNALAKAPGAKSLRNISVQTSWSWPFIGTRSCIELKGEAVK